MLDFKKEEKQKLINEIQCFFEEERDEEIGIIAGEEVLDFFIDLIGNKMYNKGLDDARLWFSKRIEDLELDYDLLYRRK